MAKELSLIVVEDCIGCEACITVCPTGALRMLADSNIAWSKPELCDGKEECGKCSEVCPVECILYVPEGDQKLEYGQDKH